MSTTFEDRLESCRKNQADSNCIGTALYLTGIIEEERRINPEEAYGIINSRNMKPTETPSRGDILSWERTTDEGARLVLHMAISELDSSGEMRLINRPGTNRTLEENSTFNDVNEEYGHCDLVYYSPSKT